ncbi:MAG: hypothetical protein PWQ27_1035 [Kosmotoga sp.]|nr:hypothetical protein [Kosmotoga sp.]
MACHPKLDSRSVLFPHTTSKNGDSPLRYCPHFQDDKHSHFLQSSSVASSADSVASLLDVVHHFRRRCMSTAKKFSPTPKECSPLTKSGLPTRSVLTSRIAALSVLGSRFLAFNQRPQASASQASLHQLTASASVLFFLGLSVSRFLPGVRNNRLRFVSFYLTASQASNVFYLRSSLLQSRSIAS